MRGRRLVGPYAAAQALCRHLPPIIMLPPLRLTDRRSGMYLCNVGVEMHASGCCRALATVLPVAGGGAGGGGSMLSGSPAMGGGRAAAGLIPSSGSRGDNKVGAGVID